MIPKSRETPAVPPACLLTCPCVPYRALAVPSLALPWLCRCAGRSSSRRRRKPLGQIPCASWDCCFRVSKRPERAETSAEGQPLELRGRARKRGRDTGSARGSRDPRGLRAPLLAKGSAARSETSSSSFSSVVAMCCKSPERAQLYLPALPSAAPEQRADQLLPSETLGPTLVRFSLSHVPCKAKQNQTQLS